MRRLAQLLALSFVTTVSSWSQTQPADDVDGLRSDKVVAAIRIADTITLDGYLDEPAWDRALPATDFVQKLPRTGEPAGNRTEARFLYDDENLYIGVFCFDSGEAFRTVNELSQDFSPGQSDIFGVLLDALHDRRSGFTFVTNPAGARRDEQISNDGQGNNSNWDGVWDVKVSTNSEGWIAEFAIPFKTVRFTSEASQEWGLQMARAVRSESEQSYWTALPVRYGITRVSLAGTLRGLEGIRQGRNLKVKPYLTGGFAEARTGTEMTTLQSPTRLKDYDVGADLKYSLTPSLTLDATYRTDFAQVEVDQQQVNLSRFSLFFPEKREFFIENSGTFAFGPGGNLVPFFSRRIGLSDSGTPIPIVGGGRLTGQVGRYDVGFLAMRTEAQTTTPANNFTVGRIKRNLLTNSWVGALLTNRDSTLDGDYNRVFGADAHFQFYNRLEFDSYILKSQTPDQSGQDLARRFQGRWRDDELVIDAEYNEFQSNFNPEMGFIRRRDVRHYRGEFTWSPLLQQSDLIRNLSAGTTVDYYEAPGGEIETREERLAFGVRFQNNANIGFTINQAFDRLQEADRIRGIEISAGDFDYLRYSASFRTDPSRKVSLDGRFDWGEFWDGHLKSLQSGLALRPDYHLNVVLDYDRHWVDLENGSTVTDLVGARLVYAFTPDASFNAFLQYNGATDEFSTNLRFRLTYRPLSDIYLVYNDRYDAQTNQSLERAFIVKVTNLINF